MSSQFASKIRLPHQSTTNIVQSPNHSIRTLSYDHYGKMLATVSAEADQTIKILKFVNNKWMEVQQIKYSACGSTLCHQHQSAIIDICFAHPLFGSIFATLSRDKIIHIFELKLTETNNDEPSFAFVQTARFKESVAIACCQFTPHHLGLKLAVVCKDGTVKIREARDISNLSQWMLSEQIIIDQNPMKSFHKLPFNPHLIQNKHMMQMHHKQELRDTKIFCISWNKCKFEFASFCVGANNNTLYIYGYTTNNRIHTKFNKTWKCIQKLVIDPNGNTFDIRSVGWSNNIGKKYHLIGIGCSDGFVRVIKITKNVKRNSNKQPFAWNVIFESKIHRTAVCKLRWNMCGTSMLSVDSDANVFLLKKDRKSNQYDAKCLNSETQKMAIDKGSEDEKEEKDAAFSGLFNVKNEPENNQSNNKHNINVNNSDNNDASFGTYDNNFNNKFASNFDSNFGSNVNQNKNDNIGSNFISDFGSNLNKNNDDNNGSNFISGFGSNVSQNNNANNASFGAFDNNFGSSFSTNEKKTNDNDNNGDNNNGSFSGFANNNNGSFSGFGSGFSFGADSNNNSWSWGNNNS